MGRKAVRPGELTPREIEVVKIVAAGLRNAEIAEKIYVSEKTVKRHISNIFAKLDMDYRAQLVAYAYKNKLVR